MRAVFFKKLKDLMEKDVNVFFLVSDTGYNIIEPIFEAHPDRTLNVGVAEQNLIGISAGLANVGFRPICYAISNFLIHRCLEQTRNDICLHNYPVTLVGISTGFDNGGLGATHHIVDDIGCLKPLPNISIYSPSSTEVMEIIFDEATQAANPSYIRIGKSSFSEGRAVGTINRFISESDNSDTLIVSHGKMVKNSIEAARNFPHVSIYAIDKIKPLENNLEELFRKYKTIIVVEDNFKSGLYNSICQFVADKKIRGSQLYSISPEEKYETYVGDPAFLEDKHGLSPEKIADFARDLQEED